MYLKLLFRNICRSYARVSSQDDRQKLGLEVQMEALKNCNIIFSEKQSGDNDNCPERTNSISLAKQLAKQNKSITLQMPPFKTLQTAL